MLKDANQSQLAALVSDVLSSGKYRDVDPDVVRYIGSQELAKRRNLKEALKATRSKLHQIGGAYFRGNEDTGVWLSALQTAIQTGEQDRIKRTSKEIMSNHASTRERIPLLDQFYSTVLADLPPIHSVLDIACGLNPLAALWMPLAADVEYYAYDIYQNMMDFLNRSLALMHISGYAQTGDVIQACPTRSVDVAFVLKVLPCLEQIDKQASYRLLRELHARYLIVSYPIHSLGGRSKGMLQHYATQFQQLVDGTNWEVGRYDFATELVFVIKKV